MKHGAPHLLKKAAYGLPELFRGEIRNFNIIANPGCYATAAILALAPLVKNRPWRPIPSSLMPSPVFPARGKSRS